MMKLTRRNALVSVGATLLVACDGGKSKTTAMPAPEPAPSPTPAASPSPTWSPNPPVGSFGTLGANTPLTYAVLGYSIRGVGTGWDFVADRSTLSLEPGASLRFVPPTTLMLALAGMGESALVSAGGSGAFNAQGERTGASFNVFSSTITVYTPYFDENTRFSHLMEAYFSSAPDLSQSNPYLNLQFLYGIPVAAADLPASGVATYDVSSNAANKDRLEIDFAARTVSGSAKLSINGVTKYELAEVTLSADGTRFSGRLVPSDGSPEGRIDGLLTGPDGKEIALRGSFPTHPQLIYPSHFAAMRTA